MKWVSRNRYLLGVYLAIAATLLVGLLVILAAPPYSRAISRSVVLWTTLPLAFLFMPFVYDVTRGRGPNGRPVDSADLFGAGVSLLCSGFALPYLRATFWNTPATCGMDTSCYSVVAGAQVILLASGLFLKMAGYVTHSFNAKRKWRMWLILAGSSLVAAAGLVYGLQGIP